MNNDDRLIGTTFDGRYRILRRIGQGGMADVLLAEDETLGRRVAIKVLHDRYARDEQFVERFLREASSAARLNHPNIVQVYDRGESNGSYYIAMEFVDGQTLKDVIRERGALPEADVIDFAKQALGALRFAHRNGIVHRDVKPHNMMIDADDRLKIADFGIARAGADQGLTEVGSIVGTAQYLSPEQARGEVVSAASDLYSMGIVMFEAATGGVPFDGDSPVNVALKHVNDPIPRPRQRNPRISAALEAVIVRAMQKDPHSRYETADEFILDLDRARAGQITDETAAVTRVIPAAVPHIERTTITPPAAAASYRAESLREKPPVASDRDGRKIWPWLLLLALLLAVAGLAVYLATAGSDNKPVPDVTGMRLDRARSELREEGFRVGDVKREFSEEERSGVVISQDPDADDEVAEGSEVDLVVSRGENTVAVPSVVGKKAAAAKRAIEGAGLEFESSEDFSEEEKGVVFEQTPSAGEKLERGETVTVVVSKGAEQTEVPSLLGLSEGEAERLLKQAGLVASTREEDGPTQQEVIDQDPAAGTKVDDGSTVEVVVASGLNTVPDVLDMPLEQAKQEIEDAGYTAEVSEETYNDPALGEGVVKEQTPISTTRAKVGSTVQITVWKHDPAAGPPPAGD